MVFSSTKVKYGDSTMPKQDKLKELEKRINERLEDVNNALNDLLGSGKLEAIQELNTKADTLEWVLSKIKELNK